MVVSSIFIHQQHARQGGLTLIELMAVIGIIGILASITLAGFTGIRERSKLATTMSALENARTGATQCMLHGESLIQPVPNTPMCATVNLRWLELGGGWEYVTTVSSVPAARTFSFSAHKISDASVCVTCTQDKCEAACP